ncbi:MAG: isoamylase early set domain-containing protein [Candidatus Omnitrophica bacterium]|nr:isoamylase early set domain-containing protein [Candidatus Omnitrophota bacterium]
MARKKNQKGAKVIFMLEAQQASKVSLAGDFNKWDEKKILLKKSKDNIWKKEVVLKPGRYEYKFVVDGNWMADPNNSNKSLSAIGTENSVIEI